MKNFNGFIDFVNEKDFLVDLVQNYITREQFEEGSFDELTGILLDGGAFCHEVIYIHNAMKYLSEGVNLDESLQIARDLGFCISDISSEFGISSQIRKSTRTMG